MDEMFYLSTAIDKVKISQKLYEVSRDRKA
jgi:hypothetical protein